MKLKTILLSLLTFTCLYSFSQNPTIEGTDFKLLSPFVKFNKSETNLLYMALAKTSDGYVMLLENVLKDYSETLLDTSGLSLTLSPYKKMKHSSSKYGWRERDEFTIMPYKVQPKSNTKGSLIAMFLSNEHAYDLKGTYLYTIEFTKRVLDSKYGVDQSTFGFKVKPESFFVKYSSKISSKQGSYENIENYKIKKIVLYSLMSKSIKQIEEKIGAPSEGVIFDGYYPGNDGDSLYTFKTDDGIYEFWVDTSGVSSTIAFTPSKKFKNASKTYITFGYPFELDNCNCGKSTVKKSSERVTVSYENKTQHWIDFKEENNHRFLKQIIISKR